MSDEALAEYEDYARDHLEHFGYIPTTFEDSEGVEYGHDQCWAAAMKLGLTIPVENELNS